MNQLKILQVIPSLHTGGAERTAIDIGEAVLERGWVSIVASAGGRMVDQLTAGGSSHVTMPLDSKNPLTIWRNAARLVRLIKNQDINLIHARSRAPAWSCLLAARRTGIPFVTTYHGAYNQNSALKGLYNSVMARADTVIANSQWTADLIVSRNPWAKDRIEVIHRGTDFETFHLENIADNRLEKLRRQWTITPDDIVIVQLARLTTWKGQGVVIKACAELIKDFPHLKIVLAGDHQGRDEYLAGLQQKIEQHGLQGRVILPGHCDDPAAAMAVADLVVVASIEAEAFGRAAVEAGALEKPVIVTRIGAVGETVLAPEDVDKDQFTGWKVTPGDAQDLAKTLRHCLSLSPDQRHLIGQRARQHGQKNFSLRQMCSKTLTIYDKLLELKPAIQSPNA